MEKGPTEHPEHPEHRFQTPIVHEIIDDRLEVPRLPYNQDEAVIIRMRGAAVVNLAGYKQIMKEQNGSTPPNSAS